MITLTKREIDVVTTISAGAVSGKEIAKIMGVGEQQVKKYLSRIYKKRNIKDKYELMQYIFELKELAHVMELQISKHQR